MKSRILLSVAFVFAFLFACGSALADSLETAKEADIAMSKAVLDRDMAAFKSLLAPNVVFLDVPEAGPDAVARAWSGFFEEKRLSLLQWQPDRGKEASSGDFAYTSGPYDYQRTGPDGQVAHFYGRYLTIWQWNEGRWQVWADGSWLDPAEGTLTTQLAALWPPAGAPDVAVEVQRKPTRVAKSKAGDLMVVLGDCELAAGDKKVRSRYAVVSEPDGKGGWKAIGEALATPAPVQ